MAKAKEVAPKKGTAVAKSGGWKGRMQEQAAVAVSMESHIGASNFFSTKNGKLSFNDTQVPHNKMAVLIIDYVLEKTWYEDDYDPDTPAAPSCYAFGEDEKTMAPHPEAPNPQADTCGECPLNEFGSAERGKGKACRDMRKLALTPAGSFSSDGDELNKREDGEYFEMSDIALLRIPPTSLRGWATFVREVSGFYHVPPIGVYSIIEIIDDDKDQFHIQFTHSGEISDEVGEAAMARQDQVRDQELLVQPYQQIVEDEKPKRKAKAKAKGKAKAKAKSRSRKY